MTEMIDLLAKIKQYLQQGAYENETHVRETIVRPILRELGWDIEDPQQLQPEYRLKDGTRLDYGLSIDGKLRVIIEVKAVGNLKEADLQLFQYAFHAGTPLALLTDGREWQFYYVYGTGDYPDRLVRILDILEHPLDEVMHYLSRYLDFAEVKLERAEDNAKQDLQDKTNRELTRKAIPKAWQRLASYETNEQLVNLLTEETAQEAGGGAPNKDDIIAFLQSLTPSAETYALPQALVESQRAVYKPPRKTAQKPVSYTLLGETDTASSPIQAYVEIMNKLARRDSNFLDRLAASHEVTKKQLSRTRLHNSSPIHGGWYLNRDLGGHRPERRLKVACRVAGIKFGRDLIFDSPAPAKRHALPQALAKSQRAVYKPRQTPAKAKKSTESSPKQKRTIIYKLLGVRKACSNFVLAYGKIIEGLSQRDPKFLDRLASKLDDKHLSREKFRKSIKIDDWYLNTDIPNYNKTKNLEIACEVAGIKFGKDLTLQKSSKKLSSYRFSASLGGATNESLRAIEIYVEIIESLARRDASFLNRLASELSEKRLSRDKANIVEPMQLSGGWFIGKAISNPAKKKFIRIACEVAGIKFGKGKDLEFDFPNA